MALTFSLAPNPKWYIADKTGKPLGGGYLATFSSLNHSILNPVFTDNMGFTTWPYVTIPNVGKLGVLFDENGSQGPFYFQFNPAVPNQLYYLEVYDSGGVLQWTIDNFIPSGAGGGSIITTAININNLISNSPMLRNSIGNTPVSATDLLKIAPGAHSGLSLTTPAKSGPDIMFLKNGTGATDTLNFVKFNQGDTFPNSEPTPVDYLHFECKGAGTGETVKCVQIPITHGVQNIQNQAVTVSVFARCTSGNANITLNWLQFFGDGPAASSSVPAAIQTVTLNSSWQKIVIVPPGSNVPSTTGKTIGECGNDGLFLQFQYPFNATTVIDMTLPSIFMGNVVPSTNFQPNDAVESVMYAPRTGYVFPAYEVTALGGYVPMNDGTIGDSSSGATTRANIDTFPLFNLLYVNVTIPSGNTLCTVSNYTGDQIADFVGHGTMQLPVSLGRALCAAGAGAGLTSRALGSIIGAESHVLGLQDIPEHSHDDPGSQFITDANAGGPFIGGSSGGKSSTTGLIHNYSGPQTAISLLQPSSFMNFYIKL